MSKSVMAQAEKAALGFGGRLRAWRLSKDWTQRDLADSLGVTPMQISHWECGRRLPSFEHLYMLVAQLHCPASYLLGTDM